jgi:hypothetical protein
MKIMNKKIEYKVGDWIIVREEILKKINVGKESDEHYHYESPQKIVKIEINFVEGESIEYYHLREIGNVRINLINFRLATEKEIKEQIIKNVFLY